MLRAEIRCLPGVLMSIEREPSIFAGLGTDSDRRRWQSHTRGSLRRHVHVRRTLHINGNQRSLGYLGALRVNPTFRHRLRVLRAGFDLIRTLSGMASSSTWYNQYCRRQSPRAPPSRSGHWRPATLRADGRTVTLALLRSRGRRLGLWQRVAREELGAACARITTVSQPAINYRRRSILNQRRQVARILRPSRTRTDGWQHGAVGPACLQAGRCPRISPAASMAATRCTTLGQSWHTGWSCLAAGAALDQTFLAFHAGNGRSGHSHSAHSGCAGAMPKPYAELRPPRQSSSPSGTAEDLPPADLPDHHLLRLL